jgi:hypothetical protein
VRLAPWPAFEKHVKAGLAALHRRFPERHSGAASIPSRETWLGQVETTQKHFGNKVNVRQDLSDTLESNVRSTYLRVGVKVEWRLQVKGAVAALVNAVNERRAVAAAAAAVTRVDRRAPYANRNRHSSTAVAVEDPVRFRTATAL